MVCEVIGLKVLYPFFSQHRIMLNFAEIMNMSQISYLWNLDISSVLVLKLYKEPRLLCRLHCQTLLSDWLTEFFSSVVTYKKWALKEPKHLFTPITNFL